MRFLLDENLPHQIAEVLRDRGHDLIEVADSPLRGSDDIVIWQRAAQEGRILITRDLDFPLPGTTPPPPGLVLIRAPETYTAADEELPMFNTETSPRCLALGHGGGL